MVRITKMMPFPKYYHVNTDMFSMGGTIYPYEMLDLFDLFHFFEII